MVHRSPAGDNALPPRAITAVALAASCGVLMWSGNTACRPLAWRHGQDGAKRVVGAPERGPVAIGKGGAHLVVERHHASTKFLFRRRERRRGKRSTHPDRFCQRPS